MSDPSSAHTRASDCLDANELAALADGRPLAAERERALSHLARCASCRSLSAALARPPSPELGALGSERPARWRRRHWLPAAAAAVVASVGAWLAIERSRSAPGVPTLAAVALELRAAAPELFDGFEPLAWQGRPPPEIALERSLGSELTYPRGRVLETRPEFHFGAASEQTAVWIALATADGLPLWRARAEQDHARYPEDRPELERGRSYLWRVEREGAAGGLPPGAVFEVASADEARRFGAALEAIERRAPVAERELWIAEYAIARNYLFDAAIAARAWSKLHPQDHQARGRLAWIERGLGFAPDASAQVSR